jgi:hypothetical protein
VVGHPVEVAADSPRDAHRMSKAIDPLLFCDACERVFRIPRSKLYPEGTFTVACPRCGRKAKVVRLNGAISIEHGTHIHTCFRPLKNNLPMAAVVFVLLFVVFLSVYGAFSMIVSPWMCPIAITLSLVAMLVFLLFSFAWRGSLTEKDVLEGLQIVVKAVPDFLGRKPLEGPVKPINSPGN